MKIKKIAVSLFAMGVASGAGMAHAADADRVAQLEAQLNELRDQVSAMAKEVVVTGDIPNSFRVPGSDVSVRMYGVAELNMVREMKGSNGDSDYSTFLPYAPLTGSAAANRQGETYMHARTSRIGIEAATPSQFGMIQAKVEGDFNNDPRTGNSAVSGDLKNIYTQQATNSYDFRLRHAYVQTPNWLVGQTWSTFMDIDNTPETVDFNGPIGSTFIRQPQVRFTYVTPESGNFVVALENAQSYVLDNTGTVMKDALNTSPDVVVRWDKPFTWGSVSLRGVSTEYRVNNGAAVDASRRGYGVSASGQVKTWGDDFLSWIVTTGTGIGRYFNYIEGAGYNAATNTIELEQAIGLVVGYQHKVNDQWRMNVVYGQQRHLENDYTTWSRSNGLDSGRFGTNRSVNQLHVGGFWNPVKVVEIGVEYMYGRRETLAGETGDMSRVNFLARYNIN